jgi:hypothetical protein
MELPSGMKQVVIAPANAKSEEIFKSAQCLSRHPHLRADAEQHVGDVFEPEMANLARSCFFPHTAIRNKTAMSRSIITYEHRRDADRRTRAKSWGKARAPQDKYKDRLLKYIPGEVVTLNLTLTALQLALLEPTSGIGLKPKASSAITSTRFSDRAFWQADVIPTQ